MVEGWDSLASSGGHTGTGRRFVGLMQDLGLNERKQALIFMSGSKKLEGNATSTDRMDHCGYLKRVFTFTKRQLQIEDVVLMNLSLTLDDTAAHGQIEYCSLTLNLSAGK
jgi:hypothetical protein